MNIFDISHFLAYLPLIHGHLVLTIPGPVSLNSALVITEELKVPKLAKTDAPLMTELIRSSLESDLTRISVPGWANPRTSVFSRSAKPSKHEEPPAKITLLSSSVLKSTSVA